MTQRDQLARPLRGHDPGDLRRSERIALRKLAQAASFSERIALRKLAQAASSGRRHAEARVRNGPPARDILAANVDHSDTASLVDVREIAHRAALADHRSR